MDEASIQKSLFISPVLEYEIDWSRGGDELTLEILSDSLIKDQTYVITIGAEATDSHKNRLTKSFQFAFSTGDKLDFGQISGTVYGLDKNDAMYIFAYRISKNDTLDPRYRKAQFFSQTGRNGIYQLNYLPLDDYRIFVVQDQNKNFKLDASYEQIGIPVQDIKIDSNSSSFENLNFMLTNIDTLAPFITSARAINKRIIQVRLSEQVKQLTSDNLIIIDTLDNSSLGIKGVSQSQENTSQYFVYTDLQDSLKNYRMTVTGIADTSGNEQTESTSVFFNSSIKVDTTKLELLSLSPQDSSKNVPINSGVKIAFSLPIITDSIRGNFRLATSNSDSVEGIWKWSEFKEGNFVVRDNLLPGNEYFYTLRLKVIKSFWGDSLADSLISSTFTTISTDEFGSLTGKILFESGNNSPLYLTVEEIRNKKIRFQIKVPENNLFKYEWLPEGKYLLKGYLDIDNNGKWSPGTLAPFSYSEPFYFQNDTIRIRKRWEVSGKTFQIPGW